jgi:hypothetical protein
MHFAQKLILTLYRTVAVIALYAILAGVIAYVSVLGVYEVNTSWVAPMLVAPNDTHGLVIADRVATSRNTLAQIIVDREHQERNLAAYQTERDELVSLRHVLTDGLRRTRTHDQAVAAELNGLLPQKEADLSRTAELVAEDSIGRSRIQKELDAGLITKTQAAEAEAQMNSVKNGLTDGRVSEVALRDSMHTKSAFNPAQIDGLVKIAEIQSRLARLEGEIAIARKQIAAFNTEKDLIEHAVDLSKETPYFVAANDGQSIDLAFVPYENQKSAKVDAPVYDCYLNYMLCRQVGTVTRIFPNEEHAQNPVFRSEMRGFLVQIWLSDRTAVRSKTLFVGGKPLGI